MLYDALEEIYLTSGLAASLLYNYVLSNVLHCDFMAGINEMKRKWYRLEIKFGGLLHASFVQIFIA